MADIITLKEHKETRNYQCVQAAVCYVAASLEGYTLMKLGTVHQKILDKLGPMPACNIRCSQTETDHKKWCHTCSSWKQELSLFFKNEKPNWKKTESWKWPESATNIADVFLPGNWDKREIDLKDIPTQSVISKRCSEVPSSIESILETLKKIRNNIAHNTALKINDTDKKGYFRDIVLCVNKVKADIKDAIPDHGELLNDIKYLEEYRSDEDIKRLLEQIQVCLKELKEQQKEQKEHKEEQKEQRSKTRSMKPLNMYIAAIVAVIGVFICSIIVMKSSVHDLRNFENEDCLSEDDHSLFPGNVRVLRYLPDNRRFIGRKWLFDMLQEKMLMNSTKHGVMMLADMGYGKSAIATNIICATTSHESFVLRSKLKAYHVCRCDSEITKKPHIFIRRVAAMLANHVTGFLGIVESRYTSCIRHFDEKKCEEDPYGCFDQCIRFPLNDLSFPKDDFNVIIIDGLDECENTLTNENELADLLTYRIDSFPRWMKFLITCRDDSMCRNLQANLEILHLKSNDTNNIDDLKEFLKINGQDLSGEYTKAFQNPTFLIATIMNSDLISTTSSVTIESYFTEQFQRYFRNRQQPTKTILSIVLSSFEDLAYWDIWYMLENTTSIEYSTYEHIMQRLKHFFQNVDGKVHLFHFSLRNWLLKETYHEFSIDTSDGHCLLARYFLILHQQMTRCIDVVEFVVHASLSSQSTYDLQQIVKINTNTLAAADCLRQEYPLHRLARRFDNPVATKHLLNHFPKVDLLNRYNRTASFIAAASGNVGTLKALIDGGADVTFRTQSFYNVINLDEAAQISFKLQHWDYGLLDIAAQNGHIDVVKFILDNANELSYPLEKKNGMNLLPLHLACKLGHKTIVKILQMENSITENKECLYFAAESGNHELVSYLLRKGVKDECKPCSSHLDWVPSGKARVQGEKMIASVKEEYRGYFVLFDDWQYLSCETALHAAVRLGNIKVTNVLTDHADNALNCSDRGGRSPFQTAVQYNRREIAGIFIRKGFFTKHITCSKGHKIKEIAQLNKREREDLELFACSVNTSILHIAAKFGRISFVEQLISYNISVDWNIKDNTGCPPIHIAACYDKTKFISLLKNRQNVTLSDIQCVDGVTLLQYTAKCGSFRTFNFILKHVQHLPKSHLTQIAFSALESSAPKTFAKNSEKWAHDIPTIVTTVLKCENDFEIIDLKKSNILHYAITNGHFFFVYYMFTQFRRTSLKLMGETNLQNQTPLQTAILSLKKTFHTVFVPADMIDTALTIDVCKHFLTPVELAIALALNFSEGLIEKNQIYEYMFQLLEKNHVSIVTAYTQYINKQILLDYRFISKVMSADPTALVTFQVLLMKLFRLNESSNDNVDCGNSCDAIIYRCHLHRLAKNSQRFAELFGMFSFETEFAFKAFFPPEALRSSKLFSLCYDKGFNILERAIQGGNVNLVKLLLDNGVESKRPITELLQMTLTPPKTKYFILPKAYNNMVLLVELLERNKSPRALFDSVVKGYKKTEDLVLSFSQSCYKLPYFSSRNHSMDLIATTIIEKYYKSLNPSSLCSKHDRKISFVHKAAFQGMENTLRKVWEYFGDDVLTCQNIHLISPLYFARRLTPHLNLESEKKFRDFYNLTLFVEKHLLFNIYTRVLVKRYGEKVTCIFEYNKVLPRNMYKILKSYICQKRMNKFLNFSQHEFSKGFENIYNGYSYLSNLKMATSICSENRQNKTCFYKKRKLQTEAEEDVFRRVTKRMDLNLKFILTGMEADVKIVLAKSAFKTSVLAELCKRKRVIDYYPSMFECPLFKRKMLSERQTWGKLRIIYKDNVMIMKYNFIVTLLNMASEIPMLHFPSFEKNLLENVLLQESAYLRFNRAFSYLKVIDKLSVFQDAYYVFFQNCAKAEGWAFVNVLSQALKYKDWSQGANPLMRELKDQT